MSFSSPFAGSASPGGAFTVPGQRRQDADVEVVVVAGTPRVDLLPAAVAAGERFRRLQRGLAAGLGLVLVGAAAATLLTGWAVSAAEDELAAHQARSVRLQTEQAQYAEVPLLRAQSATLVEARDAALAQDVLWYRYTAHLANRLPSDLRLTAMTMQLADAAAAPAAGAAATTTQAPPGGLTLSLEGVSVRDSADLLDVLAATPGVTGPWADSTTVAADGRTTVQAHADLSSAALSGRYAGQAERAAAGTSAGATGTSVVPGTDVTAAGTPALEGS